MNRSPRFAQSKLLVHQALVLALSIPLAGASIADTTLVCSEIGDSDRTRAVVEIGSSVSQLEIVTPEHAWSDPDVPEEETNVSPNLVGREEVYVSSVKDSKDQLRIIDFGVREPDALELEGLRGSLVLHEEFVDNRAFSSLFYAATGNLVSVTALLCERIEGP
ncbi:MAG: hypothetical protein LJE70_04880 [Chromatiaceae bacterium]|jgi:hypothetical protein|nr:hypothetical protein [Chromatiaceae bacterium]